MSSNNNMRLAYGGAPLFPFRFFALRSDGQVNTSDDGATFVSGVTITGAVVTWNTGAFSPALTRYLAVSTVTSINTIRTAWTDDGAIWVNQDSSAPGTPIGAAPARVVWTDLFGGRFYVMVRQSGGGLGDVFYSDDGGDTWTAVTWPTAKSGAWDPEWLVVGPDRIVVAGRFLTDSNSQLHMYYTTDGDNMLAGPLFSSTGMIQVGDDTSRGGVFSSSLSRFILAGSSASNFILPAFVTTVDGTALSVGPSNMAAGVENTRSSDGVVAFGLVIMGFSLQGTAPTTAFQRSATALAGSWTNTPESVGFTPRSRQLAYSESQARVVAAASVGGFVYTDDGVTWVPVAATVANNWRSVVATQ